MPSFVCRAQPCDSCCGIGSSSLHTFVPDKVSFLSLCEAKRRPLVALTRSLPAQRRTQRSSDVLSWRYVVTSKISVLIGIKGHMSKASSPPSAIKRFKKKKI